MESRKRPHTDDGDISVAKKRVLTGSNGSPKVNGANDQTEDGPALEEYRKDAMWRRIKQYSREHERNLSRIEDLERRRTTCEASLAAMSACWAQLIETIRLLVKAEDLAPSNIQGKDIFDIGSHLEEESIPQLKSAFERVAKETEELVTKFVNVRKGKTPEVLRDDTYIECQRAQNECAALRSELHITRKQLRECIEERDKYHAELVATQNRIERSQSRIVHAIESREASSTLKVNGGAEDTQRKPSSPLDSPNPSVDTQPQLPMGVGVSAEVLQRRENTIAKLDREIYSLNLQLVEANARREVDSIENHPIYLKLVGKHKSLKQDLVNAMDELQTCREELHQLRTTRELWESSITTHLTQTVQDLKLMISKRDAENTRLREQRDQQIAENSERKYKESVKLASLTEFKNLADSRAERISILQSELQRCKARLSASEGREDLMLFFFGGDVEKANLVESLKAQKEQAEVRAEALEHALSVYNQENPDVARHISAQAKAEEKLARVSARLAEYQKVFGDLSSLPPELSELAEQLQRQAGELERLRALNAQHEKSESALYQELEGLSTAWETLDKQVKSKVFDLSGMEERLQKALVDKAKSDNKFFSTMRDKEALDAERKNLQRILEKQGKVLDRYVHVDKAVKGRSEAYETRIATLEQSKAQLVDLNQQLSSELQELKIQLEKDRISRNERHSQLERKKQEYIQQSEACRNSEIEVIKEKDTALAEVRRLKEEAAARVVHKHGHGSKDDAEYQHLRSLLLCSTCGSNFRSVIITKCMHTFCKPCVDARITTRQRKCPACNLAFAQSDIATLYMQ